MQRDYLHNHNDFADLINIVAEQMSILPNLVEKDYWIMHCLYGLQKLNLTFEVKGGTSLNKGHNIIKRSSEDIDIHIEPPKDMEVKTGKNQTKPAHSQSRKNFYDWLAQTIKIDDIVETKRDTAFDNAKYFSGGIRLYYKSNVLETPDGVLLEIGFDNVTPNNLIDISSWAYDFAVDKVEIIDNRAKNVACYHPGYTLVEKLQAISTKYRQQQEKGSSPTFTRHYYDVYCLLHSPIVQNFIGTEEYFAHKKKRFSKGDNLVISENEAFLLSSPEIYQTYEQEYQKTSARYYEGQPEFKNIMELFQKYLDKL